MIDGFIDDLCDADFRHNISHNPPIESVIAAHMTTYPIAPAVAKLVDLTDLYLWSALAESELKTITMIESMRGRRVTA